MKYFVILCTIFVVVVAIDKELKEKFLENLMKIGEDCAKEVVATEDDIKDLINHKLPSSHEGKCLVTCMHKHLGIQNADGSLSLAGALAVMEPIKENDADVYAKIKLVLEECTSTVSNDADECITGANMFECGKKIGLEHGLTDYI